MTFISADQRELFLPLIEGISESPPWGTFMRNLAARTYARRAFLIITLANAMPSQEPTVLHFAAPRASQEPPLDFRRITALRLHPYGSLRPERVYSLEELLDYDNPEQLDAQRTELDAMGIRYGRCLRVSAGTADAWLVLVREREDFSAAAVATLSAIAPLFTVALRAQVSRSEQILQTEMAQAALARLGVGQLALDRDGRIIAADPLSEANLPIAEDPSGRPGRRLQILPEIARQVEDACAAIAHGPPGTERIIALDRHRALFLLLRRAELSLPIPSAIPAVMGTLRVAAKTNGRSAIATIAAVHGLSQREAELALGILSGETIVEAGARLHLTTETSRNYSRRIYAKTGTRGQADLVRLLFSGLTPLA
ncbi:LuxR family transcriptional regulator [Novosphingobium sp. Chol11]|uniref:helix-turn-helix transcriptional regulator n=1 Tax=Novosphingobium sp. Chol11 TaxID=1385763 RepID=UPI0025F3035D|nr:LuxR family transcriptional regulator [Novosphingobium sp. Chol11]